MNLFSSDVYLQTLGEVCFPRRRATIEIFRTRGRDFRLLVIDGEEVITTFPFLDFVEPLPTPWEGPVRQIDFLPNAVLEITPAEGWSQRAKTDDSQPAPFIDWSLFPDWSAFESMVAQRRSNLGRESRRKRRGLEREVGPLSFVLQQQQEEVFDQCVRWKSAQYLRTGLKDMFASTDSVCMFQELYRKGVLLVSSLRAGDQLLATHFGAMVDRVFYSWVAAYDPKHSAYSPGALLLEFLLQESWRRRDLEFNFLIGDQEYKWFYATHNRVIGALGDAPLARRFTTAARRPVKKVLAHFPRLLLFTRKLRRRLKL
jgi:hypothetical protein